MQEKDTIERQEQLTSEQDIIYPLIALRGRVLFPKTLMNFEVGRTMSINAVNKAREGDSQIVIAPQKNAFIENPRKREILSVGVLATITRITEGQNGSLKVSVMARERVKITTFEQEKDYFAVKIEKCPYIPLESELEAEACLRVVKNVFTAKSDRSHVVL